MRALTLTPGQRDSARLSDLPEPKDAEGSVLVQTQWVGICGTDREIVEGHYGAAPLGASDLILGHESVGRVLDAGTHEGLRKGDWVVGMVRHPDPVPCVNCAAGEWDMCRNDRYTEHGIKERHGFAVERVRLMPERLVRVAPELGELGVLLEPTSVVAKAWEHIHHIGERARWAPKRALVTGAGPIGLLAALLGVQQGIEVTVLDRATEGPKPRLVEGLGARYHEGKIDEALRGGEVDVVLECTGASPLIVGAIRSVGPSGVVCLLGVSNKGRKQPVDIGSLNRDLVLENQAVFGSVNANRRHYEQAAAALAKADRKWLSQLITRRLPLKDWKEALQKTAGGVKTVIELA